MLTFAVVDHDLRRKAEVVMRFAEIDLPCAPFDDVAEFTGSGAEYDLLLLAERPDGGYREDLAVLQARAHGQRTILYSPEPSYPTACEAVRLGALDMRQWPFDLSGLQDWWQTHARLFQPVNRLRLRARDAKARIRDLTGRETAILHAMADGKSNKAIAAQLGVSHRTIEAHRLNLIRKLGVESSNDAVRISVEARLFDPVEQDA